MTLRENIKIQKITKDSNLFELIENENIKNPKKCKICNKSIFYKNTFFRISKDGGIKYSGTSSLTCKKINTIEYGLCVCEKCLSDNFPNKKRNFNLLNDVTKFAFDIPDNIYKKEKEVSFGSGVSKDILIKRHGEIIGKEKWEEYRKKQALSNSFEYKKQKYNWTRKQFDDFNRTRAVTLNNLISKHGIENGLNKWENYIKRQKYTCSYDYFINEYGEINGNKKWNNFINSKFFKNVNYSKKSQELFNSFENIFKNYKTYYGIKNGEFNKRLSGNIIFLDYYILELQIAIEYNGNKFHANPDFYKDSDMPNPFTHETALIIKQRDSVRYNNLYDELGIKTLVIWENDIIDINIIKDKIFKLKESTLKYAEYRKI